MRDELALRRRARRALAMVVGFYAFSLVLAALLFTFGVALLALFAYIRRAAMLAVVGASSLVAAFAILRGIVPRKPDWLPPHVPLRESDAPELYAILRSLATQGATKMPDRVLITHGHNAGVTDSAPVRERGQRTLLLGAGLFSTLTVGELRAVLAHECGHFVAGDTEHGARIYVMRSAMIRVTEESLRSGGPDDVTFLLYRWMLRRFELDAAPIARDHELAADAYAAKVAGGDAMARALERVREGHAAWTQLEESLAPLSSIAVPSNSYAIYRRYCESAEWARLRERALRFERSRPPSPYDRHPPDDVRIDALRALAADTAPPDARSAATLLPHLTAIEATLCALTIAPDARIIDASSFNVVIETQQQIAGARAQSRAPWLTAGALLEVLDDRSRWDELVCAIEPEHHGDAQPDHRALIRGALVFYASAYLSSLLGQHGWRIASAFGDPIVLERGGERVELGAALARWAETEARDAALIDAIQRGGVSLDQRLAVSPEVVAQHLRPASHVEVREFGAAYEVKLQLRQVRWPRCCVECRGPASAVSIREEPVGEARTLVPVALLACEKHSATVHAALRLRDYDPMRDVATFDTKSVELARLIARANA